MVLHRRVVLACVAAAGALAAAGDAGAHPVLRDDVVADLGATELRLTVRSTLRDPVVATGAAPAEGVYFRRAELEDALAKYGPYLLAHVHADADGSPLAGRVTGARLVETTTRPVHHSIDLEKLHAEVDIVYPLQGASSANGSPAPKHLGLAFDVLADREFSPGTPWSLVYSLDVRGARSHHVELAQRSRFVFEYALGSAPESASESAPAPAPKGAVRSSDPPVTADRTGGLRWGWAAGAAIGAALLVARSRRRGRTDKRRVAAPLAFAAISLSALDASAEPRVYVAPDDHTDFIWSATEAEYAGYFPDMLDYYVGRADADIGSATAPALQSRFTADGTYWVWVYEKSRTAAQLAHLMDRVKSGHITVNMPPLDILHGCMPAEAVLRQMYYAGSLERRFGMRFKMAGVMENAALTYGVGSLWAGSGAVYSWNGTCACVSSVPNPSDRAHEIYRWVGPSGADSIVMKWYSYSGSNESIGGYAEARTPGPAIDYVTSDATFSARYRAQGGAKYDVMGVFGQGHDDRFTKDLAIQQGAIAKDQPGARRVIVSNEVDFFDDFVKTHGAALPTEAVSYGIEWDREAASIAETSARVKRSVEKLRAAESVAYLVASKDAAFWPASKAARDLAHIDMGLYFEHDLTDSAGASFATERLAFQKRVAGEIESYVNKLTTDGAASLGAKIGAPAGKTRFFVHNGLSWARTDVADLPYAGALPAKVIDVVTNAEVPSQPITIGGKPRLRILARDVPSIGYRVYEVQPGAATPPAGAPTADPSTGILSNGNVSVVVAPNGALKSFKDTSNGPGELAGAGGLNDLATGGGSIAAQDAGAVSASLVATSTAGLAHTTRVTVYRDLRRVEIENRITQNFGNERSFRFDFALPSPDTWHEEVGAIARAKLASNGGTYATRNTRYDSLPANHFVAMASASANAAVVLSNADAFVFRLGNSSVGSLDETTPAVHMIAGGVFDGLANQGGETSFLHRFALSAQPAIDHARAMRSSLEHQDPFVTGPVTGASPGAYPDDQYSLLTISDPNVLAWAVKPAEDGPNAKVVVRLWNLGKTAAAPKVTFARAVTSASKVTHIETALGAITPAGSAIDLALGPQQLSTFVAELGNETGAPPSPPPPPTVPGPGAGGAGGAQSDSGSDGGCACRAVGGSCNPSCAGGSGSGPASPSRNGCGCNVLGAGASGGLVLAGLGVAALVLRRREKKRG